MQASSRRRGLVLIRGYAAFWRALLVCTVRGVTSLDLTMDERRDLSRTLAWTLTLGFMMTAALVASPLIQVSTILPLTLKVGYLTNLIPQALPLAIPVGLTLGIVLGIRRPVSRASAKVILAIAAVCSIVSLMTLGWVMPVTNQAFRTAVSRSMGHPGPPSRGYNELTMSELSTEIKTATRLREFRRARRASAQLHERWAISAATMLLAAFAVALCNQYRAAGRIKLVAVACGMFALWLGLSYAGDFSIRRWGVPPIAGARLPNLLLTFYVLLPGALHP